jgi:hypothetical protein
MAMVVLELDPQRPDVAIDDVALRHEVRAPDGIEDLFAADDPPAATGEQVEETLLDTAQVNDRLAGPEVSGKALVRDRRGPSVVRRSREPSLTTPFVIRFSG